MSYENKNDYLNSESKESNSFKEIFYSKIIKKVFPSFSTPSKSRFINIFPNSKEENCNLSIKKETKRNKTMSIIKEKILNGKDKRTTIMIKNLPRNLNSEIISSILLLEKHINYLYIPVDSNNGKILGFAFVNMKKYINILEFIKFFEEKWKIINSNGYNKKFEICYSSVQGIKILKQTFGNYIVL